MTRTIPYWKVTLYYDEGVERSDRDIYFWCHASTPGGAIVRSLAKWQGGNDFLQREIRATVYRVEVKSAIRK